jgi:hypothetical protein
MYRERQEDLQSADILSFYGEPDSRAYLADYLAMSDMEEVFKEIVIGAKIRKKNNNYIVEVSHKERNSVLGENPLVLFNGHPVENTTELLGIPVSRVDYIDVVRQQYRIGNRVFDGIVNIVSKDLNLHLDLPLNAFKISVNIYPVESSFSRTHNEKTIPDLNPTLYWNPDLTMEGNSKQISFLAGDNPGRYQVLLTGIDGKGNVLEIQKYIIIE